MRDPSRRKLAKDPNNTKWSRNTASFGQKILRSQGWQPGQYLGAVDAPHAEFHTAANASHVRAAFQEGNLGIGAKRNRGDECTGLDAFQDLLGRLNGKSEQALETERQHRSDVKLSLYIERRFGTIRFVRGGLLVGDQLKEEDVEEVKREEEEGGENAPGILTPAESSEEAEDKRCRGEKSKKRKAEQVDDQDDEDSDAHRKEKKKLKKEKKEKKLKDRERKRTTVSETAEAADSSEAEASPEDKSSEKRKSKKDKKSEDEEDSEEAKRAAKKEKKKKKRRKEEEGEASSTAAEVSSTAISPAQTGLSTPAGSGTSTPVSSATRHLARKRFIAQKRMATMDPQALNQVSSWTWSLVSPNNARWLIIFQIFMIKS